MRYFRVRALLLHGQLGLSRRASVSRRAIARTNGGVGSLLCAGLAAGAALLPSDERGGIFVAAAIQERLAVGAASF